MDIMVIGGGGREHAIIKALRRNEAIDKIYALPGNGGIAAEAECVSIKASDIDGIAEFAKNAKADFAVVAPDDPLVLGCVDRLEAMGIPCFGPDKKAAIIEGSKAFSKGLMQKYGIPTAKSETFDTPEAAIDYIKRQNSYPAVIKADGLALGKGVVIAQSLEEAEAAVNSMMVDRVFGASGSKVIIEEFLTGPEVSVLCFTDGKTLAPMASSMDHKRALDGDDGLNTGGMGTIAPNPYYTKDVAKRCMEEIFLPTMRAMNKEGRTFKGCLYFGLMLTQSGPKVIEYNCRFGDPETQVVLPLLENDLFEVFKAVREERLAEIDIKIKEGCACCVIEASGGYPQKYNTGYEIEGLDEKGGVEGAEVFHAGTKLENGRLVTSGGRVLGVTALGKTLESAIESAYKAAERVTFKDMHMRRDIGRRALLAKPLAD